MQSGSTHHTLDLTNEGLLSIRHGRGTRIRNNKGILWITEEGEIKDTILSAGDTYTIRHSGLALLTSFGESRVTIESQAGPFHAGRAVPGRETGSRDVAGRNLARRDTVDLSSCA